MNRNKGKCSKVELKLSLGLRGGTSRATREEEEEEEDGGSSSSSPSSCISSCSSSPEATPMVLAGCPRCFMYVMLVEDDPKCPKCKNPVVLDLLQEGINNNNNSSSGSSSNSNGKKKKNKKNN